MRESSSGAADGSRSPTLTDQILDPFVDQLLQRVPETGPPPVVYHYTTSSGTLGILTTGSIWASDVRFLNDASEWAYALSLAEYAIRSVTAPMHPGWGDLAGELGRLRGMTTFVACFSEARDQLSQWRAYATQGYAIGFAAAYLSALATTMQPTAIFAPVVYDVARQRDVIAGLLERMVPLDPDALDDGAPLRHLLMGALSIAAAFFKNPAFEHEQEWRLAILPEEPPAIPRFKVDFRALRGAIVPYTSIGLNGLKASVLPEVIVGPGPDQAMASAGVQDLLRTRGLSVTSVHASATPHRGGGL